MPALARGQENTPSIINWFITVNGVLTDAHEVGFQVWDISGGLPGTILFPVPGDGSQWEDVSSGAGNFSVGAYYAYDNAAAKGWTPGLAEMVGTHRIKWRWKITAAAPYQSDAEDFEVLVQSAGSSADTYISIQNVRDEGLAVADYPDEQVLAFIETWQTFLDRACRQWFVPKAKVILADGNDSDTLFFGVPIISIDYLKLNGGAVELNADYYRIYSNQDGWPDDRRNPQIKLIRTKECRNIFTAPVTAGELRFRRGQQNQEIKGIFGFVESDGSVPKLIQRALTKLVIEKLTRPIYSASGASPPPILGTILREFTDGHSIHYGAAGGGYAERRPGLSGITEDPEILDIIKLYRAPLGIASPSDWSHY